MLETLKEHIYYNIKERREVIFIKKICLILGIFRTTSIFFSLIQEQLSIRYYSQLNN